MHLEPLKETYPVEAELLGVHTKRDYCSGFGNILLLWRPGPDHRKECAYSDGKQGQTEREGERLRECTISSVEREII